MAESLPTNIKVLAARAFFDANATGLAATNIEVLATHAFFYADVVGFVVTDVEVFTCVF